MTDIRNVGQEVQAEILKTVRRGQETVTEALKTVRTMTPAELAGHAYSIAMKVLADQRKFAEGVLHTTGQLLPGNSGTSAKKTAAPRKTGTTEAGGTAKKTGSADSSK